MILKRVTKGPGLLATTTPLSHAVVAEGKLVFIGGQVGKNPETGVLPDDFIEQAVQALENLRAVLKAVGAGPQNVVRMLLFVTEMSRTEELNRVYAEFFGKEFPTRCRVQVASLAAGYKIEMEAIAVVPQ